MLGSPLGAREIGSAFSHVPPVLFAYRSSRMRMATRSTTLNPGKDHGETFTMKQGFAGSRPIAMAFGLSDIAASIRTNRMHMAFG